MLEEGVAVQRLYSTFARGWPGMGLLFLRLSAAITAFHFSGSALALNRSLVYGGDRGRSLPCSFAPVCGHLLRAACWLGWQSGPPFLEPTTLGP